MYVYYLYIYLNYILQMSGDVMVIDGIKME